MRSYVPFEALWGMPIELPYSLLLRAGDHAWSCGQLALDADASVLAAGDLDAQSTIVCGYIDEILKRGGLPPSSVQRLLLYYVDQGDGGRARMCDIFAKRFGETVLPEPIPVPYFYYEGVMLEVDVYCATGEAHSGARSRPGATLRYVDGGETVRVSLETPDPSLDAATGLLDETLRELRIAPTDVLSEHWFAPSRMLAEIAPGGDAGATIDIGPRGDRIRGVFTFIRGAAGQAGTATRDIDAVRVVSRRRGAFVWVHARSLRPTLDLVAQTKHIMGAIERVLGELSASFADVVKSTTHYAGGSSPEELHDNMRVRNAYYKKPGPASTGLPVFGFADPASKIIVDVTAMTDPDA